jgi:hypothetical protein
MNKTGVMLSMLDLLKVLVIRDDQWNHKGAGIKRNIVTAIECVSVKSRALMPPIIWPSSTNRTN